MSFEYWGPLIFLYRYLCGSLECYDKGYDRVTVKNEKKLTRINRIFHKVTTTDDPVIRQVKYNPFIVIISASLL